MTAAHPQDAQIRALYADFLDNWNRRSGAGVAAAFADDGDVVHVDGTRHSGRLSIASDLRRVFGSTQTAAYIGLIRSVRSITDGVAVLHADAGAIPPGGNDIDPAMHAVHTLVAVAEGGRWRIASFQATPAVWSEHPEARAALTAELHGVLAPQ